MNFSGSVACPVFRFVSNAVQINTNQSQSIQGIHMSKLLNAYRAMPSPTNRAKLQRYLNTHMMAVCMASPDDVAFLRAHEFKI